MRFDRRFTRAGVSPYEALAFTQLARGERCGGQADPQAQDMVVPVSWSRAAGELLARSFARKSGVPARLRRVPEAGVPDWLNRSEPDETALIELPEQARYGAEHDARQVFDRLAGAWTYWGWKLGCFDREGDARAFFDEIRFMLATQRAAPEAPQWLNTGLHWAYGLEEASEGCVHVDPQSGEVQVSAGRFERPLVHSSYIQAVDADLVQDGGILDVWARETRPLRNHADVAASFSSVPPSTAGASPSPGFSAALELGERSAAMLGHTGGTRSAHVGADHPDIEEFVDRGLAKQHRSAALAAGAAVAVRHFETVMAAAVAACRTVGRRIDRNTTPALTAAVQAALADDIPDAAIQNIVHLARQGRKGFRFLNASIGLADRLHADEPGANAQAVIRVPQPFWDAVDREGPWQLAARNAGEAGERLEARDLWHRIALSGWSDAGPALHFGAATSDWHTCPEAADIRVVMPGTGFAFLDDTACVQATLNLLPFRGPDGGFDTQGLAHAARLWMVVLEASVAMAQYPSEAIARRSHDYRPVGLGCANLGALLMSGGVAYDSREGRAMCAAVTALMGGAAYAASAELARDLDPFCGHARHAPHMLGVIRNHRRAARGDVAAGKGLHRRPAAFEAGACPDRQLAQRARAAWDEALTLGERHGFRHAQTTLVSLSGVAARITDCSSPGIEPEFALVKHVRGPDDDQLRVVARPVVEGLKALGYRPDAIRRIVAHAVGCNSLRDSPTIDHAALRAKGFGEFELERVEAALAGAVDIRVAFNVWTLGEAFCTATLGFSEEQLFDPSFDMLRSLSFTSRDIERANTHCCGAMTFEGARDLAEKHLPVFDCTTPNGRNGARCLSIQSQIAMAAAAQPFISGAVCKDMRLPDSAGVEDCAGAHELARQSALKLSTACRAPVEDFEAAGDGAISVPAEGESEALSRIADLEEAVDADPAGAPDPVQPEPPAARRGATAAKATADAE